MHHTCIIHASYIPLCRNAMNANTDVYTYSVSDFFFAPKTVLEFPCPRAPSGSVVPASHSHTCPSLLDPAYHL